MLKGRLLLSVVAALTFAGSAYGQFIKELPEDVRDQKVFGQLVYMMLPTTTSRQTAEGKQEKYGMGSARTGKDGKTLGCYVNDAHKFNSLYKDVPAELQQQWVYDFWHYCQNRGCSFEAYRKVVGSPDNANAIARTTIKYEDQKTFSDMWWRRHYPDYKGLAPFFQDGFLNDSIVDATNVWTDFVCFDNPSALTTIWREELVSRAIQKK